LAPIIININKGAKNDFIGLYAGCGKNLWRTICADFRKFVSIDYATDLTAEMKLMAENLGNMI
jgi:hypothetical protein